MSDLFYDILCHFGAPVIWVSSNPTILHRERLHRPRAFILASTHLSPYDVSLLMYVSNRRRLDFVSIVELFRRPLVGRFFRALNVFPLDRSRPDPGTVRAVLDRLKHDRVVAMFPEGVLRNEQTSALNGGPIKTGFARIARLARVPVLPVVVLGAAKYERARAHLPHRQTRWGAAVGEPIEHDPSIDEDQDAERMTEALRASWLAIRDELERAMKDH